MFIRGLTFCRGWLGAETTTVLQIAKAIKKSTMYKVSSGGFGTDSSSGVKSWGVIWLNLSQSLVSGTTSVSWRSNKTKCYHKYPKLSFTSKWEIAFITRICEAGNSRLYFPQEDLMYKVSWKSWKVRTGKDKKWKIQNAQYQWGLPWRLTKMKQEIGTKPLTQIQLNECVLTQCRSYRCNSMCGILLGHRFMQKQLMSTNSW